MSPERAGFEFAKPAIYYSLRPDEDPADSGGG
jgi:hypothetical protein